MKGPYVIVCCAHSGGRVLSEAFIKNGIQMGVVNKRTKDTRFFAVRRNPTVKKLIEKSYDFRSMSETEKAPYKYKLKQTVEDYIKKDKIDIDKAFGWKFGETLFISQIVLETYSTAKIIHLIRDGRDVMLSRNKARFESKVQEPFNRLIIFGEKGKNQFLNEPFDNQLISEKRNELEIKHWKTCVDFGLSLSNEYSDQLMNVRYENLCKNPISELTKIFDFLELPFTKKCEKWAGKKIETNRIKKWRKIPKEKLANPIKIAGDTLSDLGYIQHDY